MDDYINRKIKKAKYRYFPFFIILVLIIGLVFVILFFPSFFTGDGVIRIPIIIDDEGPDKVDQLKLCPYFNFTKLLGEKCQFAPEALPI